MNYMQHNINSLCSPLFEKYGINFFNFARMYDDGACHIYSSNPNLIDHFFDQKYPLFVPVPKSVLKNKFYYFIPENDANYSTVNHEVRNLFGSANGFDIFQINKGSVDIACFGSMPDNTDIINFYFNNTPVLDNFVKDFKEKIVMSNDPKILLPDQMRLNFSSEDCQDNIQRHNMLSKREMDCLQYIVLGKTARDVSALLGLSKRTVEHYLENIKNKFDVNKKSELIEKAITHFNMQQGMNIIQ